MHPRARRVLRTLAGGVAATLALALGSCSGGGSTGPDDVDPDFGANDPKVVVALGDSITFGYVDSMGEACNDSVRNSAGYPARLKALTGLSVVNAGICGEDSYGGVARIEDVLHTYKPGVVLIDYSPNDITNGTEALINNLRSMITVARNHHTVPILGTLLPATGEHAGWESFIETANKKIRTLCSEQSLECADLFAAFTTNTDFLESPYALLGADGLHPNADGYEFMAKTWRWPLLRSY
jgi:lysophospholipase L1-like esterase